MFFIIFIFVCEVICRLLMGIIVPIKISVAVSMPYTGLLFASLAIMLLIDTLILAHHNKDPSMFSVFKWDNIKAVIPGYILTFFAQIAGIYIALTCGFHFTTCIPGAALYPLFIPILIGMIISVLLCASINKFVNLYTGNDDIDALQNPSKVTLDYIYHKITFMLPIFTHDHNSDFHITIPNDITKINEGAFFNYTNLTSITIPDSVTEIGEGAFESCRNLASINIPNSVTKIGMGAFALCTSLTSITIPNSVTVIGRSAFAYCTSLTSINIPGSVTKIGSGAFTGCTSLTSITIPKSVTEIGAFAFAGCSSLTSITIPHGVTEIGLYGFDGCTNLAVIIFSNPEQFNWFFLGVNRTRTQIISYQEHLTNIHADLLTATKLTDLNSNEAYLIYRLISEPEFNPSWQVLETTFNERSLTQIIRLLQNTGKDTDHLPKQIIMFEKTMMPAYFEEFLSIADRSSLFGQAQRTIDISFVKQQQVASSQQTPAAQQKTDEMPAAQQKTDEVHAAQQKTPTI